MLTTRQSQAHAKQMARGTSAVPRTKAMQKLEQVRVDAGHIIDWHFEGLPIGRRDCEQRNMPQGAWRSARQFLIAAGVMNDTGFVATTSAEAIGKLTAYWNTISGASGNADSFVAPQ